MPDERPGMPAMTPPNSHPENRIERVLKSAGNFGLVLIPVVLGVLGYVATRQQSIADEARAEFDRMNMVMDRLASKDAPKRLEGLNVLMYFVNKNCELSQVFVPALSTACRDADADVQSRASKVLRTAFANCKELRDSVLQADQLYGDTADARNTCFQDAVAEAIKQVAPAPSDSANDSANQPAAPSDLDTAVAKINEYSEKLPTRVYIQIKDNAQEPLASQIQGRLRQDGFVVPGIEVVHRMRTRTELRYFHKSDDETAQKLAGTIQQTTTFTVPTRLVPGYENRVPVNQFELWMAPLTTATEANSIAVHGSK